MSVREGMETKSVRSAGDKIESLSRQVSGIHDSGTSMLKVLESVWEGSDLGTFQSGWAEAGPQVAQAAEALRSAGTDLRRQADDQEKASDGEGGGGDGGGGWGWPDWNLPDFDFPDLNPFDGWDWDLPDIDWPDIDLGKMLDDFWDGFLDVLEDIGDWWDDLPWWGQVIAFVVGVVIGVVVAIFLGLEVLAVLATIVVIVGAVMTVLDLLDEIAEFLRDPKAAIQKFLDDPLAVLDDVFWLVVGAGVGRLLKVFRKPIEGLVDKVTPWVKRKWDDLWGKGDKPKDKPDGDGKDGDGKDGDGKDGDGKDGDGKDGDGKDGDGKDEPGEDGKPKDGDGKDEPVETQKARQAATEDADDIAKGHAYEKHVVKKGEYPEINSPKEFEEHISDVIQTGEVKHLSNGRVAYWKDGTVVIHNPNGKDMGTAFRPDDGKTYFDDLE